MLVCFRIPVSVCNREIEMNISASVIIVIYLYIPCFICIYFQMPKHKSKSKNGVASKKSKIAEPCNLNPDLVKKKNNYDNLFSKQENFEDSCLTVTNHPFNCCQMKNILEPEFLEKLNHELKGLELKEKNNDLYKFHQSGELNKVQLPALQGFKNMLLEQLKPIISQVDRKVLSYLK